MSTTTTTFLFSLTSPPLLHSHSKTLTPHLHLRRRHLTATSCTPSSTSSAGTTGDPEYDELLSQYRAPQLPTEDEARRDNWVNRGWAPWEEILSPEAAFARHSIDEGEEVPLQNPQALEAFRMLTPSYRRKKVEESGLSEAELFLKLFAIKREFPDPIETTWSGPLKLRLVPPRDWPPRGWEVDKKELEFIREAHRMQSVRVDLEEEKEEVVGVEVKEDGEELDKEVSLERYRVFLKQYKEWVAASKDRLEEESYKFDQDYYPGRRKRGKDYHDDMLELPFFYPGQICRGKVVTLNLYQGAFVDVGGVYDGWVPIKGNDWYWIRHHIKVGMQVFVEILAKRDPYRYRFPLEMRFVDPNIDHLIFNRFDFVPIFHREEDTNPEQLWRESGRQPIPRKKPTENVEDQSLLSDHPYVDMLWQIHNAEQLILDHEEENPDIYRDNKYESTADLSFDAENSIEHSEGYYKKALLPKTILKTDIKELDLDAARAERQLIKKLKKEAKERGEEYEVQKLRRNTEMDEYDLMHWQRSFEEREALVRDISCRKALGLPIDEPGRYDIDEKKIWGKDYYDPSNPIYRYDYWGEPKNSEKSRLEKEIEDHNHSIVGGWTKWYETSYEKVIRHRTLLEAREKAKAKRIKESGEDSHDDEDDDGMDFDYTIFSRIRPKSGKKLFANGTASQRISDEDVSED